MSRLDLETQKIKGKKKNQEKKKMATEKGLEEGEKEMEMMSAKVSGGCGLAGPVRVM